jgi:hypothetical protein
LGLDSDRHENERLIRHSQDLLRLRGAGPKTPLKVKIASLKDTKKNPVEEWWFSYPFVTRWWFALCVTTTLISWDKLPINLPAKSLMFHWAPILRLQVSKERARER